MTELTHQQCTAILTLNAEHLPTRIYLGQSKPGGPVSYSVADDTRPAGWRFVTYISPDGDPKTMGERTEIRRGIEGTEGSAFE